MNTIIVWLLISSTPHAGSNLVAKFATEVDCQYTKSEMREYLSHNLQCIQAKIIKEDK